MRHPSPDAPLIPFAAGPIGLGLDPDATPADLAEMLRLDLQHGELGELPGDLAAIAGLRGLGPEALAELAAAIVALHRLNAHCQALAGALVRGS